jgi:excisionase family DNA binding protein
VYARSEGNNKRVDPVPSRATRDHCGSITASATDSTVEKMRQPDRGVVRVDDAAKKENVVSARVPTVASPYLTSREAVDYLKLPSLSALYTLIREHGLPAHHRGRLRLFDVRELDAWVRRMDPLDYARQRRQASGNVPETWH